MHMKSHVRLKTGIAGPRILQWASGQSQARGSLSSCRPWPSTQRLGVKSITPMIEWLSNSDSQKAAQYPWTLAGSIVSGLCSTSVLRSGDGPSTRQATVAAPLLEFLLLLPRAHVMGILRCERGAHDRPDGITGFGPWVDASLLVRHAQGATCNAVERLREIISKPRTFANRLKQVSSSLVTCN